MTLAVREGMMFSCILSLLVIWISKKPYLFIHFLFLFNPVRIGSMLPFGKAGGGCVKMTWFLEYTPGACRQPKRVSPKLLHTHEK